MNRITGLVLGRKVNFVHRYINDYLRIVVGRKSNKRQQIFTIVTGQFLGSSRFTTNLITGNLTSGTRSFFYCCKHIFFNQFWRRFGNGLLYQFFFYRFHCSALGIADFFHNMRLIITATINQRAKTGTQLNHSTVKALSKRVGGKVRRPNFVWRINQSFCWRFSRQVNVGILSKTKNTLIPGKPLGSQFLINLHHTYIAGFGNGMFNVNRSVRIVAADVIISYS